jgi:hypothetical protein
MASFYATKVILVAKIMNVFEFVIITAEDWKLDICTTHS